MIDHIGMTTIVDAVIAITLLEGVALWLWHRATGHGVAPRDFAINMASGLALMAALRCLAAGAAPHWVLLCLLLAGVAHGTDIVLRWLRQRAGQGRDHAQQHAPKQAQQHAPKQAQQHAQGHDQKYGQTYEQKYEQNQHSKPRSLRGLEKAPA